MSGNFKIKTPHAAVLIWNYDDRVGTPSGGLTATGVKDQNGIEREEPAVIVSTLSCVSIQTNKAKGQPDGSFNLVLAPYKNWTSTLTAGSWCCILMSNQPITQEDLRKANPAHVKMFGRIETVRCETNVNDEGARQTLYYVSGVDWGTIFNSILYIDNLIASENDPGSLGNNAAVAVRNALFGKSGGPVSFNVDRNLASLLDVMGKPPAGYSSQEDKVGRLAKAIYDFILPDKVCEFFQFKGTKGDSKMLSQLINLQTGSLIAPDKYKDFHEASGFIDPFSLQGSHSIWQVLMENSNPTLNEMYCDLKFDPIEQGGAPRLMLYNRIKPFSYKSIAPAAGKVTSFESYFQFVHTHNIDTVDVMSVNAGTNWRDKFNFVEIKPNFSEFEVIANWTKQKAQAFDRKAFNREGFRPLIFETKQFPNTTSSGDPKSIGIDWSAIEQWTTLLRKWYFGTHRLLNGTIVLHGTTEYIGVGNNIKFSADLLNPNPNINKATKKQGSNEFILGHVESVSHTFGVSPDGARTYRTTINFVRGVVVSSGPENTLVGEGMLDQLATDLSQQDDRNRRNVISQSDPSDPDSQRIKS